MSKFLLKLFIAGHTQETKTAIANLKRVCEKKFAGQYKLVIIDILENPELAEDEKILATPTLIRELPRPLKRIIDGLWESEHSPLFEADIQSLNQKKKANYGNKQ